MPAETARLLDPKPGETWVDCTVGAGGHSRLFTEKLGESGRLLGLDQDPGMLEIARGRLAGLPVELVHANFDQLPEVLANRGVAQVDGVFADLGFASDQMDNVARGLSFRADGPLDMRLDPTTGATAAEYVNDLSEAALADVFWEFGEERHSRRVARKIGERRKSKPFATNAELAEVVRRAVPRSGSIDPATRVFQAAHRGQRRTRRARSAARGAAEAREAGRPRGIISFHSLEDRRVKHALRDRDRWEALTKKPVEAGDAELAANPRSRTGSESLTRCRQTAGFTDGVFPARPKCADRCHSKGHGCDRTHRGRCAPEVRRRWPQSRARGRRADSRDGAVESRPSRSRPDLEAVRPAGADTVALPGFVQRLTRKQAASGEWAIFSLAGGSAGLRLSSPDDAETPTASRTLIPEAKPPSKGAMIEEARPGAETIAPTNLPLGPGDRVPVVTTEPIAPSPYPPGAPSAGTGGGPATGQEPLPPTRPYLKPHPTAVMAEPAANPLIPSATPPAKDKTKQNPLPDPEPLTGGLVIPVAGGQPPKTDPKSDPQSLPVPPLPDPKDVVLPKIDPKPDAGLPGTPKLDPTPLPKVEPVPKTDPLPLPKVDPLGRPNQAPRPVPRPRPRRSRTRRSSVCRPFP